MDLADILDALATSDFDELLRLDEAAQRFYRVLEDRPARESYPTLDNVLTELHTYLELRIRELDAMGA